jgi:hypothetical protein
MSPPFIRADYRDNCLLLLLYVAQGNHNPVKPNGKTAGRHIISAEKVRKPVCPPAEDLVLCTQVCASQRPYQYVIQPAGNPKFREYSRPLHQGTYSPGNTLFSGMVPAISNASVRSWHQQRRRDVPRSGFHGFKAFSGHQNPSCQETIILAARGFKILKQILMNERCLL